MRNREIEFARPRDGVWVRWFPSQGYLVTPGLRGPGWKASRLACADMLAPGELVRDGDVVVEVGAGTGTETVFLSRSVGNTGTVIAVEAHPTTAVCLQETISLNRCENVRLVQVALSGSGDPVHLTTGRGVSGLANRIDAGEGGVSVAGGTLMDIVRQQGLHQIDLLKMNIEGAELDVLRGSLTTLDQVRRVMISCHDFAMGDDPGIPPTFDATRSLLKDAGFRVVTRPDHPQPWMRNYVYGYREALSAPS
ncbi:FkbM family methyltransferase [Phycicoccus badiiscoriae]|uniref:FkbM family methyltransferase n=1 Tax=Pedococcus badiiscoriae TaxID=642776 RepID=A0A852WAK5_9MICO|nr:FkbM family methyltransferase [Pedococcus badiiscoriae]NYG06078.1 FkbM family methyltransferase [Pedococcus badiiscoriae]